jgi:alpha-beta hydrolase superfamily lysophospholipase
VRADPFWFRASDGARLYTARWLPADRVDALIQIVHGMGEHALRYARFAERACAAGFAVAAHDQRGHGRSAAESLGDLGAGGWAAALRDVDELGQALLADLPRTPRVLVGHSMGSIVVRALLARGSAPLAGCALSASPVPLRGVARLGRVVARCEAWRVGEDGRSKLLHALLFGRAARAFRPSRTAFDWLSRDPAEVDAYVADPLCGFVLSPRSLAQMLACLARLERGSALRGVPRSLPIHVFAGGDDPMSGPAAVRALAGRYHRAGFERVTTRVYPGSRHETLNELDRREVEGDLLDWVTSCS